MGSRGLVGAKVKGVVESRSSTLPVYRVTVEIVKSIAT